MEFSLFSYRFELEALEPLSFPPGKAGNTIRGALGTVLPAALFSPIHPQGPSGLANPPRSFVLRASHLDGCSFRPGNRFHCGVNDFQMNARCFRAFSTAFEQLGALGLGPRRSKLRFVQASERQLSIALDPPGEAVQQLELDFLTPTELKTEGGLAEQPHFPVLFDRVRDRISTLRTLFGGGPLPIDFQAISDRAAKVLLERAELRRHDIDRHSTRTGQVHSIGGFTGTACYRGDVSEFLPFLVAATWTGVGRQTVWGKGQFRITTPVNDFTNLQY